MDANDAEELTAFRRMPGAFMISRRQVDGGGEVDANVSYLCHVSSNSHPLPAPFCRS